MNASNAVFILKSNWFSKDPDAAAEGRSLVTAMALFAGAGLFFSGHLGASQWMPATVEGVMKHGEFWRLWTALFAHGDLGHLLSNALLFIPLSYVLTGYFGGWLFPTLGFALGGLANYLTLQTMGPQGSLIGASGVVFWMGATWLTLYALVETRESKRRRFGKSLLIGAALFFPQGFEQNISYMCHFFGFALGIATGITYFTAFRKRFAQAEAGTWVIEDDLEELPQEPGSAQIDADASTANYLKSFI